MTRPDPWSCFAAEHALTPEPDDPHAWVGRAHGARVRLEVAPTGPATRQVRVAFPLERSGLVLVAHAHALGAAGSTTTGDEKLDRASYLRVDDPVDLGCFAAPVRLLAAELVARGAHVTRGALRLEPWADLDEDDAPAVVARMIELARALSIPRDEAIRAFADIVVHDPDPEVRTAFDAHARGSSVLASAVAAVVARSPDATADPATLERLALRLDDRAVGAKAKHQVMVKLLSMFPLAQCEPVVRACAQRSDTRALTLRALGRHLARPGIEVVAGLELLAACLPGTALAVDLVEAIAGTCATLGHPAALPSLVTLAAGDDPRATSAALRALVRLPLPPDDLHAALPSALRERVAQAGPELFGDAVAQAVGLVARCYREHHDRYLPLELRRATLAALGEHGTTDDQDLLVAGLGLDDDGLRLVALAGLARIGDGRALAAIRPLTSGFFRSARIKTAARAAMDAIQGRVGEAGGLALSDEGEPGALSLPSDDTRG